MYFSKVKELFLSSICLLLLALVPTSLFSQIKFPNTPAGNRANEIFALINSGDVAQAEKYVAENYSQSFKDAFPMERHVGLFTLMKERHKTLELLKINSSTDYDIDFLLHSKTSDAWLNVKLWVEENKPYLISRMGVQPGSAPAEAPDKTRETQTATSTTNTGESESNKTITREELAKFLDDLIDELVAKDEFSGTVLVARDGKPFYEKVVGYAHKGFKVPNTFDTKFNLGSMNKMFTGTAI
ncbi:MAG TPA: serine hydrolase domain-containing protein, partial [bacterium]